MAQGDWFVALEADSRVARYIGTSRASENVPLM